MYDRQAYRARWYNPRSGEYLNIDDGKSVSPEKEDAWTLPPRPDDEDWVCFAEAVASDDWRTGPGVYTISKK